MPVSSAAISGLGFSPSALVEGSWVYGYFRDGENCQEPLVLGSIPGYPLELADTSKGFNDPRSPFSSQPEYAGTPTYGPYPVNKFGPPPDNTMCFIVIYLN